MQKREKPPLGIEPNNIDESIGGAVDRICKEMVDNGHCEKSATIYLAEQIISTFEPILKSLAVVREIDVAAPPPVTVKVPRSEFNDAKELIHDTIKPMVAYSEDTVQMAKEASIVKTRNVERLSLWVDKYSDTQIKQKGN